MVKWSAVILRFHRALSNSLERTPTTFEGCSSADAQNTENSVALSKYSLDDEFAASSGGTKKRHLFRNSMSISTTASIGKGVVSKVAFHENINISLKTVGRFSQFFKASKCVGDMYALRL